MDTLNQGMSANVWLQFFTGGITGICITVCVYLFIIPYFAQFRALLYKFARRMRTYVGSPMNHETDSSHEMLMYNGVFINIMSQIAQLSLDEIRDADVVRDYYRRELDYDPMLQNEVRAGVATQYDAQGPGDIDQSQRGRNRATIDQSLRDCATCLEPTRSEERDEGTAEYARPIDLTIVPDGAGIIALYNHTNIRGRNTGDSRVVKSRDLFSAQNKGINMIRMTATGADSALCDDDARHVAQPVIECYISRTFSIIDRDLGVMIPGENLCPGVECEWMDLQHDGCAQRQSQGDIFDWIIIAHKSSSARDVLYLISISDFTKMCSGSCRIGYTHNNGIIIATKTKGARYYTLSIAPMYLCRNVSEIIRIADMNQIQLDNIITKRGSSRLLYEIEVYECDKHVTFAPTARDESSAEQSTLDES